MQYSLPFIYICIFISRSIIKIESKNSIKIMLSNCKIYEASHYFPVSRNNQILCYFQFIISFGIQVTISYLAMIYSYIALILFIKPNIIGSAFNIFLIYFFLYFLYIRIIVYILKIPKTKIIYIL